MPTVFGLELIIAGEWGIVNPALYKRLLHSDSMN